MYLFYTRGRGFQSKAESPPILVTPPPSPPLSPTRTALPPTATCSISKSIGPFALFVRDAAVAWILSHKENSREKCILRVAPTLLCPRARTTHFYDVEREPAWMLRRATNGDCSGWVSSRRSNLFIDYDCTNQDASLKERSTG